MARFFKISLILLLVGLFDHSHAKDDGKELIEKVMKKLGKLPGLIGQAFELYETFEGIYELLSPQKDEPSTDQRLDMIFNKLDQLSNNMKAFENMLNQKLDQLQIKNSLRKRLNAFYNKVDRLDTPHYKDFLYYTNESNLFPKDQLLVYAKRVLTRVNTVLDDIHKTFNKNVGIKHNIPTLLTDRIITQDFMCAVQRSPQQILHILFQTIMLSEVKGYAMIIFADEVRSIAKKMTEKTSNRDVAIQKFQDRMNSTFPVVKRAMIRASREIWACDASPKEGKSYARFGPVFQKYIAYEDSVFNYATMRRDACGSRCEDIKYGNDQCRGEKCTGHRCTGQVRDCQSKGLEVEICVANDGYRKFQYFNYGSNKYGMNQTCDQDPISRNSVIWFFDRCDYCLCTCISEDKTIDKYISLKPVFSDFNDSKVITAARIRLTNNIFRIEIKQGVILKNGQIDAKRNDWKVAEDLKISDGAVSGKDYYEITWGKKTVCLDDVDASMMVGPKKHHGSFVLTGLQFQQVGDQIQLSTYFSHYEFKTGKLMNIENQEHLMLSLNNRVYFNQSELDIPIRHVNVKPLPSENKCVQLTTSGLEQDGGQNVLPFVDIQSIETSPPVPLSGAGLFIRADVENESGGYLAMKLFTYNFEPYLRKSDQVIA